MPAFFLLEKSPIFVKKPPEAAEKRPGTGRIQKKVKKNRPCNVRVPSPLAVAPPRRAKKNFAGSEKGRIFAPAFDS